MHLERTKKKRIENTHLERALNEDAHLERALNEDAHLERALKTAY